MNKEVESDKRVKDMYIGARHSRKQIKTMMAFAKTAEERKVLASLMPQKSGSKKLVKVEQPAKKKK